MSYSAQPAAGEKKQVPLWVIIAVGVALLAFVGWLGYYNFVAPKTYPKDARAVTREAHWAELAKQSGGDMNKLSPEDRAQFEKEAGPFAAHILETMAKQ